MDNFPDGATLDPRAPYNEKELPNNEYIVTLQISTMVTSSEEGLFNEIHEIESYLKKGNFSVDNIEYEEV